MAAKKKQQKPPMPKWDQAGVPWREDLKFTEKLTTIDAKSYMDWVFNVLPQAQGLYNTKLSDEPSKTGIQVGDFWFIMRPLPVYRWTQAMFLGITMGPPYWDKVTLKLNRRGQFVTWDAPVKIPVLTAYRGYNDLDVWMSLTPMEILTQRAGVKRARGKVLMGGLGLGWLARRVLERKQVEHLTVYDTNADVLDYFGKPLKEEFNGKVTLKLGDVYDAQASKYDRILLDIWQGYGDAEFDHQLRELRTKVPSQALWTWGYAHRA
jgi:hypothetical protein